MRVTPDIVPRRPRSPVLIQKNRSWHKPVISSSRNDGIPGGDERVGCGHLTVPHGPGAPLSRAGSSPDRGRTLAGYVLTTFPWVPLPREVVSSADCLNRQPGPAAPTSPLAYQVAHWMSKPGGCEP